MKKLLTSLALLIALIPSVVLRDERTHIFCTSESLARELRKTFQDHPESGRKLLAILQGMFRVQKTEEGCIELAPSHVLYSIESAKNGIDKIRLGSMRLTVMGSEIIVRPHQFLFRIQVWD